MSIAVIGAGKWGSALFHAFSENNECVISSRTPREMPNFVSLEEALECEYLVCTIPTSYKFMAKTKLQKQRSKDPSRQQGHRHGKS